MLDCSISLAWFFPDEINGYADSVFESLDANQPVVPTIWMYEFSNALLAAERRRRLTEAETAAIITEAGDLFIETDAQPGDAGELLRLARELQLSAYDASYLELALRRSLPIATLDNKLRSAAQTIGVVIYDH